jgi:xanthine dehydrogenase accessory factor
VLYEVHVEHSQHVAIFGAGHVAQALVPMLAQLPVQIRWIDSRENFFNSASDGLPLDIARNTSAAPNFAAIVKSAARVPSSILALNNVTAITNDEPDQELTALPNNTWVIILTHNHQLDYELVEGALKHPSLGFIGMIGSETKAKRFLTKLEHRGFNASQRAKLTSPICDLSIPGKRPIEVSVSVCAQLIKLLHASPTEGKTRESEAGSIKSANTRSNAHKIEGAGVNLIAANALDENGQGRSK